VQSRSKQMRDASDRASRLGRPLWRTLSAIRGAGLGVHLYRGLLRYLSAARYRRNFNRELANSRRKLPGEVCSRRAGSRTRARARSIVPLASPAPRRRCTREPCIFIETPPTAKVPLFEYSKRRRPLWRGRMGHNVVPVLPARACCDLQLVRDSF